MKKIVSIVGGRPNLIKLAAIHNIIAKKFSHIILHTGQHYDYRLSQKFFEELKIPDTNENLEIGSGTHAQQTAKLLIGCEEFYLKKKPDMVIVYGDMNSTLGASLAAAKLHIPIAHVESGTRCFDRRVPEETNRIITDHISNLLFAPTKNALSLLKKENLGNKTLFTGDVTYDIFLKSKTMIDEKYIEKIKLKKNQYYFATIHRAENTDNKDRLSKILSEINKLKLPTILPLHPRTKKMLKTHKLRIKGNKIRIIEPTSYIQSLSLQNFSRAVLTDSGGIQKESYFLKKPCITFRDSTEWPETVSSGWNVLFFTQKKSLRAIVDNFKTPKYTKKFYGNGHAADKIVNVLEKYLETL